MCILFILLLVLIFIGLCASDHKPPYYKVHKEKLITIKSSVVGIKEKMIKSDKVLSIINELDNYLQKYIRPNYDFSKNNYYRDYWKYVEVIQVRYNGIYIGEDDSDSIMSLIINLESYMLKEIEQAALSEIIAEHFQQYELCLTTSAGAGDYTKAHWYYKLYLKSDYKEQYKLNYEHAYQTYQANKEVNRDTLY